MDIDTELTDYQNTRTFEAVPFGGKSPEDKAETARTKKEPVDHVRRNAASWVEMGVSPFGADTAANNLYWDLRRNYSHEFSYDETRRRMREYDEPGYDRHIDEMIDEALAGKSEEDKDATEQENLALAVAELEADSNVPEVNPIPKELLPELLVLMQTVYGGQLYVNAKNLISRYRLGACTKEEQNAQVITRFLKRNKVDTNDFKFMAPHGFSGYSGYSMSSISYPEYMRQRLGEAKRFKFSGKSEEDKEATASTLKYVVMLRNKHAMRTWENNSESGEPLDKDLEWPDDYGIYGFRTLDECEAFIMAVTDVEGWEEAEMISDADEMFVQTVMGLDAVRRYNETGKTAKGSIVTYGANTHEEIAAYRKGIEAGRGHYDAEAFLLPSDQVSLLHHEDLEEAFQGKTPEDKAETQRIKDEIERKKAARKVMSNRELANRFVNTGIRIGRSYGSMMVRNDVLYSYATPIAIRVPNGSVVVDTYRYSQTTSKQMGYVLGAGGIRVPHNEFMEFARLKHVDRDGRLQEAFAGKSEEDKEATAIEVEKKRRQEELKRAVEKSRFQKDWKRRLDNSFRNAEVEIDDEGNGKIPININFGEGTMHFRNGTFDYIEAKVNTDDVISEYLDVENELTDEWEKFLDANNTKQLGWSGKRDREEIFDQWLKVKKFHKDNDGYTGNWEDWRGDNFSYVQFTSEEGRNHGESEYIMINDTIYSGDADAFLIAQSESDESLFDGALDYQWGINQFERDLEKWLLFKGRNLENIPREELLGMIQDETNRYQHDELEKMTDEQLREVYMTVMTETEHESQMHLNLERKMGVLA